MNLSKRYTIFFSSLKRVVAVFLLTSSTSVFAQQVAELKKLSLEELLNLEVTLVSKQPQNLSEVASAIQVLTNEDIRRSTAFRLPGALRLLPNLHVSQITSYATTVSARGFNALFANKMLVMIDGRTVYSPLFAGVFWDVQNVMMDDVQQIEAISGPGGTLWGMNAVNGVINVQTKSSRETQGIYASAAFGDYLKDFGAIRYGGKLGENFTYRVFMQRYNHGSLYNTIDNQRNNDSWDLLQGGFRLDGDLTEKDELMVQGNVYKGNEFTAPAKSPIDGQNILGRWTHRLSETSRYQLQLFFDRTWRKDMPSTIGDQMTTYDLEFQHSTAVGDRHLLLWGLGYRLMDNLTINSTTRVGFLPAHRSMPLYSSFIQDEIEVVKDKLKLTVGSKFQHNFYSGFEFQPSMRIAYSHAEGHTLWSAVSRAIRAPSRIDVDYHIPTYPVEPGTPTVNGGPNFQSEKVMAYELGYRLQPSEHLLFSLATFYNRYYDLYSVEALPEDPVRYQIQNGTEGTSSGVEVSAIYRMFPGLKLRGGYTYFQKSLNNKPGHVYDFRTLGFDPANQFVLQTMLDLPANFMLDIATRFVDELTDKAIPSYFSLNARAAWSYKKFELSFNAQNILKGHREFNAFEVPSHYYGKITYGLTRE